MLVLILSWVLDQLTRRHAGVHQGGAGYYVYRNTFECGEHYSGSSRSVRYTSRSLMFNLVATCHDDDEPGRMVLNLVVRRLGEWHYLIAGKWEVPNFW